MKRPRWIAGLLMLGLAAVPSAVLPAAARGCDPLIHEAPVEGPVRIDVPSNAPWKEGQAFV